MSNMFTGIVEEVGEIVSIRRGSHSATLKIKGKEIFSDMKLGDSIAVNGICLTVTEFSGNVFSTDPLSDRAYGSAPPDSKNRFLFLFSEKYLPQAEYT